MVKKGNAFNDDAAKRIARTVRAYENQICADGVQTPEGQACAPPARSRFKPNKGAAERPRRLRVKEEFNNYLRCVTWDGSNEGTSNLYVAKPYELRHVLSYYELIDTLTTTQVYEVDVTGGGESETWRVTPAYQVDNEIWAMQSSDGTGLQTDEPADILLIDINVGGRAWAVVDE